MDEFTPKTASETEFGDAEEGEGDDKEDEEEWGT
jgi:hypothetical protein